MPSSARKLEGSREKWRTMKPVGCGLDDSSSARLVP